MDRVVDILGNLDDLLLCFGGIEPASPDVVSRADRRPGPLLLEEQAPVTS